MRAKQWLFFGMFFGFLISVARILIIYLNGADINSNNIFGLAIASVVTMVIYGLIAWLTGLAKNKYLFSISLGLCFGIIISNINALVFQMLLPSVYVFLEHWKIFIYLLSIIITSVFVFLKR